MSYDYGLIGNCTTAALVSKEGSIDWCCFPRFDSPSVFARLLDRKKGGCWAIKPLGKYTVRQRYLKNTAVLKTTFENRRQAFTVYDFFPRFRVDGRIVMENTIFRLIKVLRGRPQVRIIYNPKLNYARGKTRIYIENDFLVAAQKNNRLLLASNLDLAAIQKKKAMILPRRAYCTIMFNPSFNPQRQEAKETRPTLPVIHHRLHQTIAYWRDFVEKGTWPRLYKEEVIRSAITVKLLTYDKTGAVIAAPTTSLPEVLGGKRNWDYRYCWLRDSSLAITALTRICHFDEAEQYMKYLERVLLSSKKKTRLARLQILYGVEGERNLPEKTLAHLSGYQGSRPVRIGNAAYQQKQIDVAGEVIYSIHEFYVHYGYKDSLDGRIWQLVKDLVSYVQREWKTRDHSIWEFRQIQEHFTFSKLLCWVAVDRAIELAEHFHQHYPSSWLRLRRQIRDSILSYAYYPSKKTFTMFYGSTALDASILLLPYYEFLDPNDEKMKSTIQAIERELARSVLLRRYNLPDRLGSSSSAFLLCSFWLTIALYLTGQKQKAHDYFRHVKRYANHLGLYAEDIAMGTKELRGNFPQAYTHLGFILTATLLYGKGIKRPVCQLH